MEKTGKVHLNQVINSDIIKTTYRNNITSVIFLLKMDNLTMMIHQQTQIQGRFPK